MATLDMSANPACERAHKGEPVHSEEVVVNGNGTLKNVFVWVKSGLPEGAQWATPAGTTELDQRGCMYKPHVIGLMTGPEFRNQEQRSDQPQHSPAAAGESGLERIAIAGAGAVGQELRDARKS